VIPQAGTRAQRSYNTRKKFGGVHVRFSRDRSGILNHPLNPSQACQKSCPFRARASRFQKFRPFPLTVTNSRCVLPIYSTAWPSYINESGARFNARISQGLSTYRGGGFLPVIYVLNCASFKFTLSPLKFRIGPLTTARRLWHPTLVIPSIAGA
jgi:hypothetical protein